MTEEQRKAIFEKAKKKREEEKAKKSSGAYSGEYESIHYVALSTDAERVVRLLGLPKDCREQPTDAKLSYIGMLKADDGKKTRIIFPDHQTHKNWILWRIIDLVLDGKMVGSGDSRHREYTYEKVHPECFKRVRYNDNETNPYESGFYPTAFVNINCIDRSDMEWHKENKHTKLLSKRASRIGDSDNFYFDTGIPVGCYNMIFDECVEPFGDWEEYDVVIKKLNDNPWYKVLSGTADFNRISDVSKQLVVDGPLTDEERSWERYDLDQLYGVTSYSKIKAKLGDFIKKVDVDFKKNFYAELEELVEKEKAQWKAEGKDDFGRTPSEGKAMSTDDWKEEEKEDIPAEELVPTPTSEEEKPAQRPAVRTRVPAGLDWNALYDGSYNGTKYLGVLEMNDEEKASVLGVADDGQFIYKKECRLMEDQVTKFKSPDFFHVDPLTGEIF